MLCVLQGCGCRPELQKSIIVQNTIPLDDCVSLAVAHSDISGSIPRKSKKQQDNSSEKNAIES